MCGETEIGDEDWKGPPADSSEVARWSEVDDRSLNLSRDGTSQTKVFV